MALKSRMFLGSDRLEATLVQDAAHVVAGDRGPHVGLIQNALTIIDDLVIGDDERVALIYGPSTAAAVLSYKKKRGIINRTYQSVPDNIVGKMTMASLDNEMFALQSPPTPGTQGACTRLSLPSQSKPEIAPPNGVTLAFSGFNSSNSQT